MENFIVSARKYRPASFETVVGQRALTETLRNAIRSNHLAHAYLFCGPRGVGKTTCARIFAKTINCLSPTAEHDACNECESCRAFNEQRSFNIHELDAASNNSVDDIRSLIEQVRIPPQIGKYSVYIIDEVHMLSQGAFNALLKTLEEPPAHAIFILATTEKHKVLPTILSRCQVFDFARMTVADTVHHLQYVAQKEGIQAEEEALNVIAQKADGGMRDALSIFDQLVVFSGNQLTYQKAIDALNVLSTDYYFRLVDMALQGQVPESLLLFNEVLCKGFDAGHFVGGLASHLRDLLVAKDPQTTILLETSESIRQHYTEQATKCSAVWLFKALDVVSTADLNYRTARNKRLCVELMLVKLCTLLQAMAAPAAPQAAPQPAATSRPAASAPHQLPISSPSAPPASNGALHGQSAGNSAAVAAPKPAATPVQTSSQPAASQAIPQMPVMPGAMPPMPGAMPPMPGMPSMPGVPQTPGSAPVTNSSPQSTQSAPKPQNVPFTAEQMANAWRDLGPSLFAGDERMIAMLSNIAIERVDDLTYCLPLVNILQEDELMRVKPKMLRFLMDKLHNTGVRLTFRIVEQDLVQKAYTAEEKLNLLQQMNPQLAQLRVSLGLSLD